MRDEGAEVAEESRNIGMKARADDCPERVKLMP
jgi:hypothetical protein